MTVSATGKVRALVLVWITLATGGCGGDDDGVGPPDDTCADMGTATYVGTEDVAVTSGACPTATDVDVTFTIVQAAGSCTFTLANSLVSGTVFSGTVSGNDVSWTGSYPSASGTVTINSVDAALSADLTALSGSFDWTYQGNTQCTGTTTFALTRQ